MRDKHGHRWSGWPGAYCFYCGGEDAREHCIAVHADAVECKCGKFMCEDSDEHGGLVGCKEHVNVPCPAPDELKDATDRKMNPGSMGCH